jgi:hypothetical protein
MLFPALGNRLRRAGHAFDAATADNIVELCRQSRAAVFTPPIDRDFLTEVYVDSLRPLSAVNHPHDSLH